MPIELRESLRAAAETLRRYQRLHEFLPTQMQQIESAYDCNYL